MTQKNETPIVIYENANQIVEVRLDARHDTVWLRQEQMSQLFGRERSVITKHLRNVFAEEELDANSVCAKFAHTAADGKTYQVEHYNLDVIISLGYRVKSRQGTRFRQWATRADAGQMHLYLNYAREHWMLSGENPPVGLILCAQKDNAVAHYALEGLPNKVLAAEYKTVLPDAERIAKEIDAGRRELSIRAKELSNTKQRTRKPVRRTK